MARRGFRLLAIALSIFGVTLSRAHSQSPKQFYDSGYARAPQVNGEAIAAPPAAGQSGGADSKSASSPPVSSEPHAAAQTPGATRTRVILYVSSKDRRHFELVMRQAFQLSSKRQDVTVAEIYHVGDYRNVSPQILNEAQARKIFLTAVSQVPSRLNVESSPAWILRDSRGEHIVEGFLGIESCVGPKGEYQEPERAIVEAPAGLTTGVKAF